MVFNRNDYVFEYILSCACIEIQFSIPVGKVPVRPEQGLYFHACQGNVLFDFSKIPPLQIGQESVTGCIVQGLR